MKCPRCGGEMIVAEQYFLCPDCQYVLKREESTKATDQNVRLAEEINTSNEQQAQIDEQKAREEAERVAHDEAINAEIKELKSQLSALKAQVSAKKKEISAKSKQLSSKAQKDKKDKLVRVIRDSVILALCVVLFALSFCSVSTMDIDDMLANLGYSQIEGVHFTLSTVDYISLMSYTAKDYKQPSDVDDNLINDIEDSMVELQEHITLTASGKVIIDEKGNQLLRKMVVAMLKMQAGDVSINGTADEATIIATGIVALLYVLFAGALLVIAVVNLLMSLLKKNDALHKVAMAMIPAYFIFALLTLFMCTGVGIQAGSAMIATLFFGALAVLAIGAYTVIFAKKGARISLIPKFVSVAIVVVVMACAFAPAFTAKVGITPSGKSNMREYKYDLPLSTLGELIVKDGATEGDMSVRLEIENILKNPDIQLETLRSEYATSVAVRMLVGCMHDYSTYKEISALSMGYWLMILVGIAGAISVGAIFAMANGKNTEKLDIAMKILMIIFIACMLVCCVTGLVLAQDTLNDYYEIPKDRASFGLGGGVISMLILAVLALVNDCVSKNILKKANKVEDFAIEKDKEAVVEVEPAQQIV